MIEEVDSGISIIMSNHEPEEMKIVKDNINYNKKLTIVFWVCALITGNSMCINTLIQSFSYDPASTEIPNPPTILRSWFPFDDNWNNFSIVYLTQFTAMWIGMIIVPCYHSFIVGFLIYGIVILKILNYKLENINVSHIKNFEKFNCY